MGVSDRMKMLHRSIGVMRRSRDGRWLVLEDNVRVPSGVGYATSSRRLMKQVFPERYRDTPSLVSVAVH